MNNTEPLSITEENPAQLRCMQIFGGNRTIVQRFDLPGIDAYLTSHAYGGLYGGDIHYLSTCGHGEIVRFLIADVAGHGANVADVAMRFRSLIAKNINRLDQSRLARKLNAKFVSDNDGGRFVTALFATYHRPSGHLLICNAGHPRPLLYRIRTKQWELIDYRIEDKVDKLLNLPLGIIHPTGYRQFAVRLFPGDFVVMYTDGFSDSRLQAGSFGESRILEAARRTPVDDVEAFASALRRDLGSGKEPGEPEDDESLLIVSPTDQYFEPLTIQERLQALGKMMGITRIDG